jgi:rSAM/selenodomain-associated transferase 1
MAPLMGSFSPAIGLSLNSAKTPNDREAGKRGDALLIFVKYHVRGRVKTRLSPELTPEEASTFYGALARDIVRVNGSSDDYETTVYFAPESAYSELRSWLGPGVPLQKQRGEDLGERQHRAIEQALGSGYDRVVLIGSDCPTITPSDVKTALESLREADLVIGPAEDGGYYLIGLDRPVRSIFEDIEWSSERVLRQTLEKAENVGLRVRLLDVKRDIDRYGDLEAYYRSVREGRREPLGRESWEVLESFLGGRV